MKRMAWWERDDLGEGRGGPDETQPGFSDQTESQAFPSRAAAHSKSPRFEKMINPSVFITSVAVEGSEIIESSSKSALCTLLTQ